MGSKRSRHVNPGQLRLSTAWVVVLLPLIATCDVLEFDCPGDVKISVETGTTPKFDWSPDCEVTGLWVKDQETGKFVWAIEGASNPFKPPVVYGSTPKSVKTLTSPAPLLTDRKYVVEVFGAAPYGIATKGKRDFVGE